MADNNVNRPPSGSVAAARAKYEQLNAKVEESKRTPRLGTVTAATSTAHSADDKKRKEEEEKKRHADEKLKKEEDDKRKKEEEKKKKEDEKKRHELEKKQKEDEEKKKKEDEKRLKEEKKKQEEDEKKRKKDEDERRKKEDEERKRKEKDDAARKKADEELARKKKDEEETARKKKEADEREVVAKKKRDDEEAARQKKEADEAAARKKKEEEAAARKKTEEEAAARKKAEEEAVARKKEEEEAAARKKAEEEAAARKKAEEEAAARKKKEEEEAARKKRDEEEAAARQKAEDEATRKKKEEEEAAARKKAEEEAARRKKEEEEARHREEEEERAAAQRRKEDEQRRKHEEEETAARKKKEEEEAAARKHAEEEAATRKKHEDVAPTHKQNTEAEAHSQARDLQPSPGGSTSDLSGAESAVEDTPEEKERKRQELEDLAHFLDMQRKKQQAEEERAEEEQKKREAEQREKMVCEEMALLEKSARAADEAKKKEEAEATSAAAHQAAANPAAEARRKALTEAEKTQRLQMLSAKIQKIQKEDEAEETATAILAKSNLSRATTFNLGKLKMKDAAKQTKDDRVVKSVPRPTDNVLQSALLFDSKGRPSHELLKNHFVKEGRIDINAAKRIVTEMRKVLEKEPNILDIQCPCIIVGDIHGQFFDLQTVFKKGGSPATTQYLFLGDYVDRGSFSMETVLYMFSLKLNFPTTFWMLRGNHESRVCTQHFNFKKEVKTKYSEELYDLIMSCFDALPIAAIVAGKKGKMFCLHGGLSPFLHEMEDIRQLDRFQDVPETGPFCDLLWADPVEEKSFNTLKELEAYRRITFESNANRGTSYSYGFAFIKDFLKENKLLCLVRAHEVQKDGYMRHYFGRKDRVDPYVITVFSAPNYCDTYGNLAALLRYEGEKYDFIQFSEEPHPYWLPNFQNAFLYTLPFISENTIKVFTTLIGLCTANAEENDEVDATIKKKLEFMLRAAMLFKQERIAKQKEIEMQKSHEQFEKVMVMDGKNEKRPIVKRKAKAGLVRTNSVYF